MQYLTIFNLLSRPRRRLPQRRVHLRRAPRRRRRRRRPPSKKLTITMTIFDPELKTGTKNTVYTTSTKLDFYATTTIIVPTGANLFHERWFLKPLSQVLLRMMSKIETEIWIVQLDFSLVYFFKFQRNYQRSKGRKINWKYLKGLRNLKLFCPKISLNEYLMDI